MAELHTKIVTPSGNSAPDILANKNKVAVSQGASEGVNAGGTKGTVTHGNLDATEAAPIDKNSTCYVFVDGAGANAFLDDNEDAANVPGTKAFRIGRAWKGADGSFIVCQGKRGAGVVEYNIGGDPVPRRLIDNGDSQTPVQPASPFQGAGRLTLDVKVTVKGSGQAKVSVVDKDGKTVSTRIYSGGTQNKPDAIIVGNVGDVLEYQTDAGTSITMTAVKGTEQI